MPIGYDLLTSGGIDGMVQGVAVQAERPVFQYMTVAFGGSYVQGGSAGATTITDAAAKRLFVGAGPGVRFPVGNHTFFGHILLGFHQQSMDYGRAHGKLEMSEFGQRLGGGLQLNRGGSSIRVGIDYDGEIHLVAGVAFGF